MRYPNFLVPKSMVFNKVVTKDPGTPSTLERLELISQVYCGNMRYAGSKHTKIEGTQLPISQVEVVADTNAHSCMRDGYFGRRLLEQLLVH